MYQTVNITLGRDSAQKNGPQLAHPKVPKITSSVLPRELPGCLLRLPPTKQNKRVHSPLDPLFLLVVSVIKKHQHWLVNQHKLIPKNIFHAL